MDNAANNIDAKSKSLKDILFERHYKVGYFQREYKWQRNHVEDLLVDLERSFNANWEKNHSQKDVASYDKYYMGPIVLFQDDAEFSVVDGQQRLTSFSLLMIFLNEQFKRILNVENKFQGYIYSDYFGTFSYNMNIPERLNVLDFLYTGKELMELSVVNESCINILERYNDIKELFPAALLEKEILPLFANWLTEKLVFIEILTQTSESAYTIFETMNDRGLNLTQTELLKSFLLSNVKDDTLIKELDGLWKSKMSLLNAVDNDQEFFKAWLRAKYAMTIRTSEKGSANEDFEKIGTRFSSWTQENTKVKHSGSSKLLLDIKDPSTFYFFVKSDFAFYSELYLKLRHYELAEVSPEHRVRLISYKGVSSSLSYPLILAPITKLDDEQTISKKINIVVRYIDAFGVFRMLLNEPITHSSIRNSIYLKVKEVRNLELKELKAKLENEIIDYRDLFLSQGYTRYDSYNAKYILARILIHKSPDLLFENIYFQRKKDSYILYQFLKSSDFESEKYNLPKGLKDLLVLGLLSYTLLPRQLAAELDSLDLKKRLTRLKKDNLLVTSNQTDLDFENLKDYFIKREKKLKEEIISIWKV